MVTTQRSCIRYSEAFKMQVIRDLESGTFRTLGEASEHYGIRGSVTVRKWLLKYGRNHLCAKVIRVEKPEEQSQFKQLKEQIRQLETALAQTQIESLVNRSVFEVLCKEMGLDPDEYKKKVDTKPSATPARRRRQRKKK